MFVCRHSVLIPAISLGDPSESQIPPENHPKHTQNEKCIKLTPQICPPQNTESRIHTGRHLKSYFLRQCWTFRKESWASASGGEANAPPGFGHSVEHLFKILTFCVSILTFGRNSNICSPKKFASLYNNSCRRPWKECLSNWKVEMNGII